MIKNVESVKRNVEILHVSKVTGKTTFSELNLPVSNRLTLELLYAGTFIKKYRELGNRANKFELNALIFFLNDFLITKITQRTFKLFDRQ